ncbi:hypothetical protein KCP69_23365 [Salmonella enterica subsp. enterica]|nr:hypothetical protein KCP69_23365 [Salmonella enterica subsp. enterica]
MAVEAGARGAIIAPDKRFLTISTVKPQMPQPGRTLAAGIAGMVTVEQRCRCGI